MGITYPPEMLPSPGEGQEADVIVDGKIIYSTGGTAVTETTPNDEKPKLSAFELAANTFIQNATSMYVNGLRSSIPQAPLPGLMVKAASALGVAFGQVFSLGALGDIFPLRKACIDAFAAGIKSVKIEAPQPMPGQPKLNS